MIRALRAQATALLSSFVRSDVAGIFGEFIEWVISEKKQNRVSGRVGSLADALLRVERSLEGSRALDSNAITAVLTTEEIRRIGLLGIFLAKRGLLSANEEERRDHSEARRLAASLTELRGRAGEQLRDYHAWLTTAERPRGPRTLRLYVRAAIELVRDAEVGRFEDLSVEHLRTFLRGKPGHRASLVAFAKFLKTRMNVLLAVPPKRMKKHGAVRDAVRGVKRLLALLETIPTRNGRRAVIADLVAAAYGVPLEDVLRLRNQDVRFSGANTQIRLGDDWLDAVGPLDELIAEVIANQEGTAAAPLFPGRLHGDSLSVSAVHYYSASPTATTDHLP